MTKLHIRRLQKLAGHLERGKLGHKVFHFGVWNGDVYGTQLYVNGCGTSGCAIGECPFVFPKSWHFKSGMPVQIGASLPRLHCKRTHVPFECAKAFFGLTEEQADDLFIPGAQLYSDADRKAVARNMRAFIRIQEKRIKQTKPK